VTIPATMVNHVAVDIAAAPDAVWREIVELYVEAKKFREQGSVTPLDDPAAPLGAYRMRIDHGGSVIDERLCQITERDEATRRLSMFADYLSVPGGMQVYATYQAQEAPGGTRFALDCHSRLSLEMPAEGPAGLAGALAAGKAQADHYLVAFLESVKAGLEAAQ
jgi:hypothetical protein